MSEIPTFSIIVPYYNSYFTLARCIESILNQSFSKFELILIDDGSTDLSFDIAENAVFQDSRVSNFRQENQGVSSARNFGLSKAMGEYLLFIDSDDWVDVEYLSHLEQYCGDHQKLVIQGFTVHTRTEDFSCIKFENEYLSIHSILNSDHFFKLVKYCAPFGKVYSRSIVLKYALMFDTSLSYGEDLIFLLQYVSHIKFVHFVPLANYHYDVSNEFSLSKIVNSFESEYQLFSKVYHCCDKLIVLFSVTQHEAVCRIMLFASNYLMRSIISIYGGIQNYSAKERFHFLYAAGSNKHILSIIVHSCDSILFRYKFVSFLLIVGQLRVLDICFRLLFLFKRII